MNRRKEDLLKVQHIAGEDKIVPPAPTGSLAEVPADIDDVVKIEKDEWTIQKVRKHFHLDEREPAKYVAKSLAECEALNRR